MTNHHEMILEDAQSDFDMFLSQRNWSSAQAVIDSLRESGFDHEADILRKAYLKEQFDSLEDKDTYLDRKQKRDEFLEEEGRVEADVMQDQVGEYILREGEDGLEKFYLPSGIDLIF